MSNYTIIEDLDLSNITPYATKNHFMKAHLPQDVAIRRNEEYAQGYPSQGYPSQGYPNQSQGYINRAIRGNNTMMYPQMMAQDIPQISTPPPSSPQSFLADKEMDCQEILLHVENCPLCSHYFRKDIKFYWIFIAILLLIIFLLSSKRFK